MNMFELEPTKDYQQIAKYHKLTCSYILLIISTIIKKYINTIIDKVNPTKNIKDLYKVNIFLYKNTIFSYDEKIEIFRKIYSGKITSKDVEMFIMYHNHIANYAIQKIGQPTEDIVKTAFFVGNINFIEYLIDTKYPITSKHLTYLLNYNKNNLNKLIQTLNKYNTINYFDNFDWYYHLHYLFPDITPFSLKNGTPKY
jgi:hypothetical protein